jgi:hypothetical protein
MLTRRRLLAGCAGSLALAVTGLGPTGLAFAGKKVDSPSKKKIQVNLDNGLSQDEFRALLGEWFYAYDGSGIAVDLKLVDVIDYPSDASLDQFILRFSGSTVPALVGGMVELEHLSAGKTYLYLEVAQTGVLENIYEATCSLVG